MLNKTYSNVGVFPDYGNVGTQLNVERDTGKPTTTMPSRSRPNNNLMRIRHGLKGEVHFYCVTHLGKDMLIAISDDTQTRYYWECAGHRHPYLLDVPVRSFEDAWHRLYEALVFDSRQTSTRMQRSMALFMAESFDHAAYGDYTSRVTGQIGSQSIALDLEINSHTPKGQISVSFKAPHAWITRNMSISTPLVQQVKSALLHS